ncbi:MAG: MotA/TolQ/ExbB proton channel family protein [Deltaproteobacteria bacterium]|nr:MotA/TolQ/ExbB proton channel family protein [Deltaproteobacteria bacterium]
MDLVSGSTGVGIFVLLMLLGISVVSWGIIFLKWRQIQSARRDTASFIDLFWKVRDLDRLGQAIQAGETGGPAARVFKAGYGELLSMGVGDETSPAAKSPQWSPNLERALQRALNAEQTRLESLLIFLATAGSASPFIGLFGTVWGIMASFHAIGQLKSADLAVVAPGIAEALIATAVGLFAAIPAVIAYNFLGTKVRVLMRDLNGFGADLLNAIQRHFIRKGN